MDTFVSIFCIISVSMGPGQIALTRMFDAASSFARLFVKPITPALEAEEELKPAYPIRPKYQNMQDP